MGAAEAQSYLNHLATERNVAASTQNQALNALVFLYREVLGKELGKIGDIERPTRKPKLPTVLSKEETARLLAAIAPEYQLMVQLLYGTGMRLLECLRLRVKDVDFAQSKIEVHDGNGMKDRVTMSPEKLKAPLRLHLEKVKLWHEQDLAKGAGEVYLPFALASGIRGSVVECGGPPPLSRASTKGRVVLQMNARLRVVTTLETGIGRDAKFNRRYPPRDPAFNRLRGKLPEFPICSFAITTRRCSEFSFN